jgi:hypothetical protein
MAKGQKRSAREVKKPKAAKKPVVVVSSAIDRSASVLAPQRRPSR